LKDKLLEFYYENVVSVVEEIIENEETERKE
jgi:hypothetical protein